jgi:hypothetical protein
MARSPSSLTSTPFGSFLLWSFRLSAYEARRLVVGSPSLKRSFWSTPEIFTGTVNPRYGDGSGVSGSEAPCTSVQLSAARAETAPKPHDRTAAAKTNLFIRTPQNTTRPLAQVKE